MKSNQYTAAEIIRKSWITKTIVYDKLKRLQSMGLIVKSDRKYEFSSTFFSKKSPQKSTIFGMPKIQRIFEQLIKKIPAQK